MALLADPEPSTIAQVFRDGGQGLTVIMVLKLATTWCYFSTLTRTRVGGTKSCAGRQRWHPRVRRAAILRHPHPGHQLRKRRQDNTRSTVARCGGWSLLESRWGTRALLRCEISGRGEPAGQSSDRSGEFSERRGDPQRGAGVDSEFVVAAAQILQEGVTGDHDLRCPISL
jgi:hypothetical protein